MSEALISKLRHEMAHAEEHGFQRSTIWLSREDTDAICGAFAEVARLREAASEPKRMQHVATGGVYDVLAHGAQIQTSSPLSDYDRVTVYRGADRQIWVRPDGEFWDGRRFVPVKREP